MKQIPLSATRSRDSGRFSRLRKLDKMIKAKSPGAEIEVQVVTMSDEFASSRRTEFFDQIAAAVMPTSRGLAF